MTRLWMIGLVGFVGSALLGCEEEKKAPPPVAAAPAPAPAPPPVKDPEPAAEEKKDEPEQSPLQKCCMALNRGAFSMGAERRFYAKGAEACREASEAKQEFAQAKAKINKAIGTAKVPPECE